MSTTYSISLSGTIISSSKARSVMGRVSRCSGCDFELSTIMSYQQDKKMWELKHSRQACRQRKNELAVDEHIERMFMG
jgi:hypothetical protein